jgi:hypothetical protein
MVSQMGKLFTMFYSYFNNQGNMLINEAKSIVGSKQSKGGKAASMFYLYIMSMMIPSFIADIIGASMRGALPDDDDDNGTSLDEWFKFFAISQARYPVAMIPYMRDVGNYVIGKFSDSPFDDRISGSPVFSMWERGVSAPFSIKKAIFNDGDVSKATKDTLTMLGLGGLPTGFMMRPATYIADVAEGDSKIPKEPVKGGLEVMRGLLQGPQVKSAK